MPRKTQATTLILTIIAATLIVGVYFYVNSNVRSTTGTQQAAVAKELPIAKPSGIIRSNIEALAYNHFTNLFGADQDVSNFQLVEPVESFKSRITKKTYGLYITLTTSPIEGDHFIGYHNGVDVEFTDSLKVEVPVRAIADGTIVISEWAKGYGGVIVIKHNINGVPVFALYGHLDTASFLPADIVQVKAGQQIGVLGDDHSQETDGVRKHLHFSIFVGDKPDIRGYVQTEAELINWLNPLDFYSIN